MPYRIYAGISFYGRKEVKDVLAYLRLVVNNYDDESLVRIINLPARGIGNTTLDRLRLAAADNDVSIWTVMENLQSFGLGINSGAETKIQEFMTMIKLFSAHVYDTNAYDLAKRIVNASGLITMLRNDDDPDNANRIENIEELLNGIQEFCEREDLITPDENGEQKTEVVELKTLDQFLQQVLLLTSEDKGEDKDADKVSLMTIHSAKGLEFPYVYVVGMEENLFPSMLSISSRQDLEEERRLFYVAVTRAEVQLTLSYAMARFQYGNTSFQEMSRFVEEIDPQYILMPRSRQSAFPKPGSMPNSLFARKKSDTTSGSILHRTTKTVNSQPSTLGRQSSGVPSAQPQTVNTPKGPTMGNTPAEIDAIQVGMTVSHSKFGIGKVQSVEGSGDSRKAVIFFNNVGQKQLMLKFAKLTIVS